MKQLYLSSYHLSPQNIQAYVETIKRHQLVYLLGYASSLHTLAQFILEQNLSTYRLKAVISNAEPLYPHQKNVISQAFQCPVYDTYGLSENVCAASECLNGQMHLWLEVGCTEVFDDLEDVPIPEGQTGRLICTGLLNLSMPLIRYEVGDRGCLSTETDCVCGRQMPILGVIEGRSDDVIITRDGRRIGRLDPVFKVDLPVREAQVVQTDLDQITVRYVPAPGCTENDLKTLVERMQERLGEMAISLEQVEQIPRTSNGKFKAVISKVNKE
jgi:phenylacetate-CoA ligase